MAEIDAAILEYLDEHPDAVDSVRGIATWWLGRELSDIPIVEAALARLVARECVQRIQLADGSFVFGKRMGT